jgi:hypothetical protein
VEQNNDDPGNLDEATARTLAVRGSVCPRSIQKAYRGEPVRGMAGHRALAALKAAGLTPRPRTRLVEGSDEG